MRTLWAGVCLLAACGSPGAARQTDRPTSPRTPSRTTSAPNAFTAGARIAATADGAIAIDEDSGSLVTLDGRSLAIDRGAGLLVYDPIGERVYVADRRADRIVVVDAKKLSITARWSTPAEPFGVALTPDRKSLLVTTIADRKLVALDTSSGAERWRVSISPGARGVAIDPQGTRALVSSVSVNTLDLIEVDGAHRIARIPFDLSCASCDESTGYARGTGAVRFIDNKRVVATFQRSIPMALLDLKRDVYGGGARVPITQHVAFFTLSENNALETVAQLAENQPKSFAWNAASDTLYIAGHGADTLTVVPGILRPDLTELEGTATSATLGSTGTCGADGMALSAEGDVLLWCAFTRRILLLAKLGKGLETGTLTESPALVDSAADDGVQRGRILFETTNRAINMDRALACTTCHIDGQADGLSWRIGAQSLQTPVLAGRIAGTAPYRWDGSAATIEASLDSTIHRLGGSGLSPDDRSVLVAYIQSLPHPRTPTLDAKAIARGKDVFEHDAGCSTCHDGATYSDGELHRFTSTLVAANTPSLIGLASSAPYYHDGSAATLAELLHGGGSVHGMADLGKLTQAQLADLETFLQSL